MQTCRRQSNHLHLGNMFQNVVCKIASILSRTQCVEWRVRLPFPSQHGYPVRISGVVSD